MISAANPCSPCFTRNLREIFNPLDRITVKGMLFDWLAGDSEKKIQYTVFWQQSLSLNGP